MEHERNGTIFREEPSSNIDEHPKTVDYSSMMALEHTIDFVKVEIGIPTSKWYKKEKIVVKTTNGGKLFEKRFKGPAAEMCGPAGGPLVRFVIPEIERNDFFQVEVVRDWRLLPYGFVIPTPEISFRLPLEKVILKHNEPPQSITHTDISSGISVTITAVAHTPKPKGSWLKEESNKHFSNADSTPMLFASPGLLLKRFKAWVKDVI